MYPLNFMNPFWRVNQRFTPFWMPRVPSPTDIREWDLELDPPGTSLAYPLPKGERLKVSLHRLLVETGIAQTLATSSWDPRSWYALYRYGLDFVGTTPSLRFYNGVKDKDPRLTAVASEEVATGITCYLLREHFALDHIADVYACLQRGELEYVDADSRVRPDFFCEDKNGLTVLAESKGATGTNCAISKRIDPEGWEQVQNVRPVNKPLRTSCSRVVIGTHFCVDGMHARSETTTIIKDPDGEPSQNANPNSGELMRLAYAKVFRFAGLDYLAEKLLGINVETHISADNLGRCPMIQGLPVVPLCPLPFGGLLCLHAFVVEALFLEDGESVVNAIRKVVTDFRRNGIGLEGVGYALPNGVVVVYDEKSIEQ